MIKDVFIKKQVRAIIHLELIFYKNHNLLIYLKFVMPATKVIKINNEFLSFDKFFEKSDDINNVNNSISSFR